MLFLGRLTLTATRNWENSLNSDQQSQKRAPVLELRSCMGALLTLGYPLVFGQLAVMAMSVTDAVIAGRS